MHLKPLVPLLALLTGPLPLTAEDAPATPAPPPTTVDDDAPETPLIVTADRRETPAPRSTASVSRVDTSDDRERGYVLNSWEWLEGLPGVDAVAANGGLDGGLGRVRIRGANSFDTQWRVDGIPLNDPSTTQGQIPPAYLPSAGLDSVEVVRGPQSGLYGSRAVGGVVNLITARPTIEHHTTTRAEAGSFGTVRGVAQATGPLADGLGYSIAIDGLHSDGFSARTDADAQGDAKDHEADGIDRLGAHGRVEWQAFDSTSIYLAARYQALNQEFDGFAGPDDSEATSKLRSTALSTGTRSRLGDRLSLEFDLSWQGSERAYHLTSTTDYSGDQRYVAIKARYQMFQWLELAIGGDGSREEVGIDDGLSEVDHHAWLGGGWTQLYSASDHHDLSLSARHDVSNRSEDATTWRAAVAGHAFERRLTLRGAVATAFRAPSLFELYDSYSGNTALEPQESLSWEVGVRIVPCSGLSLESTWFETDYDRLIGTDAAFLYINVTDYRIRGSENGASLDLWDRHVTLRAAYTWVDTVHVPSDASFETFTPYLPRHLANVAAIVRGQPGWVRIGFTRRGAAPTSAFDSISQIAWASVVDAAVGVDLGRHWEVSARIDNLLDEDYEVTPGYTTSGLAAYGGVTARF
jgi:vitamin B12 transporter